MGELDSALDALAADDLHALPAGAQLARIRQLAQIRNRLEAEIARSVRVAETTQAPEHDGQKTMASWLRGHGHLSPRAAGLLVRNGRALSHLPAVAAGCVAGMITADQLALIAPITTPANLAAAAAQDIDLAVIDQALADVATGERYDRLAQVVHHYLSALDPDGPEPDPTEHRSLHITRLDDGSRSLRGGLDAVGGEKVDTALEAMVQAGRCAGDTRTRDQQLADALVQLADLALASGDLPTLRTVKPHVLVTVTADDLRAAAAHSNCSRATHEPEGSETSDGFEGFPAPHEPAGGPRPSREPGPAYPHIPGLAETGFGTLLSTAEIRHLTCDSMLTAILLDPDGLPIHHGRNKRVASPQLRRIVVVNDEHCVFAGCQAPHYWCDIHHVVHWLDGGETEPENSGLLCERHHTKIHHGFRIERDPYGRWHTYRPDGTEILVYPKLRT